MIAFGRRVAALSGWDQRKLTDFLNLSNPDEQLEYWDHRLDTRIWRTVMDTLLAPRLLGLCYASPFLESLPMDFGPRLRHRLRRGWASHTNRTNPYAASLLLGTLPAEPGISASPIKFVCADAADYLENCSPAVFDSFALSNIGDGAPARYLRRLHAAIERAAAPGAVVVTRSFSEPNQDNVANWAAQDRSMLWGIVEVTRVGVDNPCSIC